MLSIAVLRLWPASRRRARLNRLHTLAENNQAEMRSAALRQLDDALRALTAAQRYQVSHGRQDGAAQTGTLIHRIEMARDRIASDYLPSPANAPGQRRELDLASVQASEAVAASCAAIQARIRDGAPLPPGLLGRACQAVIELDDTGLSVP